MAITIQYQGEKDYSDIIQSALDKGGTIFVKSGDYTISKTLLISSHTTLILDSDAVFFTADFSKHSRHDFLITNKNHSEGNTDISIIGGVWDGNCQKNPRGKLFGEGYTGTMMNFFNVSHLSLKNLRLKNPQCYYVRMSKVCDFNISDIFFDTEYILPNQDGIHLGGFCKNGTIQNLTASKGSPNDDFVALNADDCLSRLQNLDILSGPIENIKIQNLYSPLCHSFIRMLSVDSPISDIYTQNFKGSCKAFAVNMDGARYCKKGTKLLKRLDKRYYFGCGDIKNVLIEDIEVYSKKRQKALILAESNVDNFCVRHFRTSKKYSGTKALHVGYSQREKVIVKYTDGIIKQYTKPLLKRCRLKADLYEEIFIKKDISKK